MLNDSAFCDWADGPVEEFGPISEEEQPQLAGNQAATYRNVWHTVRAGGSAADLAKIDTARIRHVQINDGPLAPRVRRAHAGTSAEAQPREAMAALRLALSAYLV